MIESKELQDRGHTLDELAKMISLFGPELPDELPLMVLFRWDPSYLTEEEQVQIPKEWQDFKKKLKPNEKARISSMLGSAVRVEGIATLGKLRDIDEISLATSIPNGAINPVGQKTARALKVSFSRPVKN